MPLRFQRLVSRQSELTQLMPANSEMCLRPIEEHGFALYKGALCLQYGWLPSGLPAKCVCGHGYTVDHAMNYTSGGFPTLHHNELWDFSTAALSGVCHDVVIESGLQLLSG